jgi:hypothetical protein
MKQWRRAKGDHQVGPLDITADQAEAKFLLRWLCRRSAPDAVSGCESPQKPLRLFRHLVIDRRRRSGDDQPGTVEVGRLESPPYHVEARRLGDLVGDVRGDDPNVGSRGDELAKLGGGDRPPADENDGAAGQVEEQR